MSSPTPGLSKADLSTPALLVDLDAFEANLRRMADHVAAAGVALRPHAKTHKCPEVARRQVALGAVGISTATVAEAEAMAAAGLPGVLLTSPIVDRGKVDRMVELKRRGGDVLLAVGHEREAELLDEAARSSGVTLDVLLDLDVGDRRLGVEPGEPARALAARIGRCRALHLVGVQAYSGLASHVVGHRARRAFSEGVLGRAVDERERLARDGFDARVLSVGSTGTYDIDSAIAGVTELQCGSYVFLDDEYRRIGSAGGATSYDAFAPSLSVLATVVNVRDDLAIVDAGIKAFATDVPIDPGVIGRPGLAYKRRGDEFGQLTGPGELLPRIGERLEFNVPHCDPTVNLYDRLHAVRGDRVEAIWPVVARRE
ncbi:MAG TPA: alanine racemase [Isosphaeraceae bacterium]|jgi:D-serine deaminase-like pyridoxal phosphate-dependent protein|nr:alanine racemase [Isosphaeraceae bacterium]